MQQIIMKIIPKIDYEKFVKPILCMFGLYTLGIISIIRADFLYIDDLGRALAGYRFDIFARYVSDFLAIFLHADTRITDISPLPQLIAALLIACASVLLVYIISGDKINKTACFLSLPIGLSPYFLECFSYKFDAPYMALSILVSIVPFLFMCNLLWFLVCSIISIWIMLTTYQASSGIYIVIVMMLCFKAWNEREKTDGEIIRFAAVSALSYCAAMIYFFFFVMKGIKTYLSLDMHTLPVGVLNNFISYTDTFSTLSREKENF